MHCLAPMSILFREIVISEEALEGQWMRIKLLTILGNRITEKTLELLFTQQGQEHFLTNLLWIGLARRYTGGIAIANFWTTTSGIYTPPPPMIMFLHQNNCRKAFSKVSLPSPISKAAWISKFWKLKWIWWKRSITNLPLKTSVTSNECEFHAQICYAKSDNYCNFSISNTGWVHISCQNILRSNCCLVWCVRLTDTNALGPQT